MGIGNAWRELWRPNPSTMTRPRRRMYAGAETSRLTSSWATSVSSADSEIKGSLSKLRSRSRQLVRDSDYAKNAIQTIVNNTVGTGIKLQAQVRKQRAGKNGKLDERCNQAIEREWKKWGRKDCCDAAQKMSWEDINRAAIRQMAEGGECIIRIIRGIKFGRSNVPMALQVLESEMLDENYSGKSPSKGLEWRMGCLVDKYGAVKKYAFFTRHPGDTLFPTDISAQKNQHVIVDAKDVIMLYKVERPGQHRGTPWLSSAIQRLHHLDGYEKAELVKARASSALTAFVSSPEAELAGMSDDVEDGERVYDLEPGAVRLLQPGEQIHVPDLHAPDGQFQPFLTAMLRAVASSMNISYESLSRDYSMSNYSSSRLSLLQDQAGYKSLQRQLEESLLQVVYDEWLELAYLEGLLDLPAYLAQPDMYRSVRWCYPPFHWVDPEKETKSALMAVQAGFRTQADVIQEMGSDFEEVINQRKLEIETAKQLGLSFISDPASATETASKVEEDKPKQDDEEKATT